MSEDAATPLPLPPSLPPAAPSAPSNAPAVFDRSMFPSPHRPWRQFFLDHNPCLLVSTVCMLLGCFLVNSALKENAATFKTIALLAVVNVYEACIIPLGLVLIRRTRGAARDGLWLVLFECLFLVNATFVNVDFGPHWSWPFHVTLFVLACIKVAVLLQGLKIGLGLRTFGFFVLQLAVIYGMPILFALVQVDGVVSPRVMYGLWWLVGMLPPLYLFLTRREEASAQRTGDVHPPGRQEKWDLVQNVIRRTYVIAPWLLMVMHLSFSHWAHHSDFQLADISPVLLGLALASSRFALGGPLRVWVRLLPVAALICSIGHFAIGEPAVLDWTIQSTNTAPLTPLHFALAGMLVTYGFLISPFHGRWAAVAVVLAGIGDLWKAPLVRSIRWLLQLLQNFFNAAVYQIPSTAFAWGILAIALAFLLLAIGSIIGLKRTTFQPPPS